MKPKQIIFMNALLEGGTFRNAIKKAGVSNQTGYNWMKNEEFKNELQSRKVEMLDDVSRKMQSGFSIAVNQLMMLIESGEIAPQVKINAIDCLFRNARPLIEQIDILKRIQDIEESIGKKNEERDS